MTSSEHTLDFGEETKPIDLSTEEEEEPETTDEPEEADEQPPTEEEAKMIPGVPAPQPVQPAQIVQQPPPLFDDAPDQRPAQPRV
jgi:hypothetical protein